MLGRRADAESARLHACTLVESVRRTIIKRVWGTGGPPHGRHSRACLAWYKVTYLVGKSMAVLLPSPFSSRPNTRGAPTLTRKSIMSRIMSLGNYEAQIAVLLGEMPRYPVPTCRCISTVRICSTRIVGEQVHDDDDVLSSRFVPIVRRQIHTIRG